MYICYETLQIKISHETNPTRGFVLSQVQNDTSVSYNTIKLLCTLSF
jgi:hypothetical protein